MGIGIPDVQPEHLAVGNGCAAGPPDRHDRCASCAQNRDHATADAASGPQDCDSLAYETTVEGFRSWRVKPEARLSMSGHAVHAGSTIRPGMIRRLQNRTASQFTPAAVRTLNLASAAFALLVLSPALLLTAAMVRVTSRGSILYWSPRVGRHGRIFQMPKFRTMKVGTPQVATDKLTDPASRLTPVGGLLRKLSLDELPQLWSVIKGDMNLVGPRPALFNQQELIAARKSRGVDALRPGITGWAQINGRDDISEWRKVELDEEYLRRQSLWFDLQILWLTAWRVLQRDGVSH